MEDRVWKNVVGQDSPSAAGCARAVFVLALVGGRVGARAVARAWGVEAGVAAGGLVAEAGEGLD